MNFKIHKHFSTLLCHKNVHYNLKILVNKKNHYIFLGKLIDMNMKVYSSTKSSILDSRKFQFKKNTLLLGDLISDYEMCLKMGDQNLIAIAFLEKDKNQSLEKYLKVFDIVILGDGDFLVPDKILRKVGNIQENPIFKERLVRNQNTKDLFEMIEEL